MAKTTQDEGTQVLLTTDQVEYRRTCTFHCCLTQGSAEYRGHVERIVLVDADEALAAAGWL